MTDTNALVGLVAELGLLTDTPTLQRVCLDGRRIADLSGQKPASMARPYSRFASHADKNHKTIAALEIDNAR